MRKKTKRLGALGATALVALVVIGPAAGIAQGAATTTTDGSGTTTTLPPQTSIHGSMNNTNKCVSVLNPPLQPGGATNIGVGVAADAFPQPHEGDQITLSNTKLTLSIPATLLQVGVDAGIIFDKQVIPSTLNLVVKGDGTTQGSHKYTVNSSVTVHVNNGVAAPLTASLNLPSTKWDPIDKNTDVFFSEKSLVITSNIDLTASLGLLLVVQFTCNPNGSTQFLALGGLKEPPTTTTVATTTTVPATVATTVPATVPVAPTAAGQLPRTGSNTGWLFALAVGLLSMGLFALKASGRRAARSRS